MRADGEAYAYAAGREIPSRFAWRLVLPVYYPVGARQATYLVILSPSADASA